MGMAMRAGCKRRAGRGLVACLLEAEAKSHTSLYSLFPHVGKVMGYVLARRHGQVPKGIMACVHVVHVMSGAACLQRVVLHALLLAEAKSHTCLYSLFPRVGKFMGYVLARWHGQVPRASWLVCMWCM